MTIFDIIVVAATLVAIGLGFRAGLLRSAVTILGYIAAMPIAIWATSLIAPQAVTGIGQPLTQSSLIFFAAFLGAGIVLGLLLRMAIDDMIGSDIGIADRLGGALLGAVQAGLIAVTLVLIFDRLIPANRQPAYLAGSALRPMLSAAAATGIKSLPPEVVAQIDKLKRERRI